ncbi:uncharacterized protein BJ171DRAFT_597362 [Polychytrium aggregatum]|uniref:uncharacterized protein n=1 Tax=Polychytrium aggregatum TaxID=110093 RepID=UPI0022FE53C8|nr:uncharacterized protein BJ171DRAFT_597362 [Polychytrium aggregatum]KAI9206711.1 hypothetical protein BJ171DRAFT_597362 [Polychytrium aggregatum]
MTVAVPLSHNRRSSLSVVPMMKSAGESAGSSFPGNRKASIVSTQNSKSAPPPPMRKDTRTEYANGSHGSSSSHKKVYRQHYESFDVIKGPISIQMQIHFVWYGILLIIAHYAHFLTLQFWTLPLYCFSCYAVVQVSRLLNHVSSISMIPMYLSYIPYCIFHLLARDAHLLFGVLWFVSIMGINLQIGTYDMNKHVIGSSVIFLTLYLCLTKIMEAFYTESPNSIQFLVASAASASVASCQDTNVATVFDSYSGNCYLTFSVNWSEEATFVVSLFLLATALYMLQRFIQLYSFSLIDRQKHVARLFKLNADLATQLKALRKDDQLDLESPITKVIKVIRNFQDTCDFNADTMESLDFVVQILSSNRLFMPNLNVGKEAMDSDVNQWLNAMITNQSSTNPNSTTSISNLYAQPVIEVITKSVSSNDSRINEVLEKIDSWDFNIFELNEATQGRPLFYLTKAIFDRCNFKGHFNIEESVLDSFLTKIESGYNKNVPYHNSMHGADVMHAIYYFIYVLGLDEFLTMEDLLMMQDCFSGIVAGAIHDFEHPGVNNAFLVNSSAQLALRYNDQAVLENFHCSRAFEVMTSSPDCNILGKFAPDQFKPIRTSILSTVLATDMAGHFEYIAKFKNKISGAGFDFNDQKDRQLLLEMCIKCGDISNAAKATELCTKWAYLIMEEFFRQGDEEKKRGIPVSMFFDRHNTVIPKCQVGFIDYIVSPLYEAWNTYINQDGDFPAWDNVQKNREHWKKLQESELITVTAQGGPPAPKTS